MTYSEYLQTNVPLDLQRHSFDVTFSIACFSFMKQIIIFYCMICLEKSQLVVLSLKIIGIKSSLQKDIADHKAMYPALPEE